MLNGFSSSAPRRSLSAVKKEIEELSPEERQRVYDDIYGRLAESKVDDTPELEDRSLHELDRCIQDIEGEERACYDRAVELCPEYVHDRAFRILFLRADLFDAKCAANRMVKYWSEKFKLWGEERAYRANPITINDFDETDLIALEKGGVRSLPSKDKSKRRLIIIDKTRFDQRQSHRESMVRKIFSCNVSSCSMEKLMIVTLPQSFDSFGICIMWLWRMLMRKRMELLILLALREESQL